MRNYADITYQYLKMQKKRTILTVIGIILSVSLVSAIFTMVVSMREMMIREAIRETGDYHAVFSGVKAYNIGKIRKNVHVVNSAVTAGIGDAAAAETTERDRMGMDEVPPYRYLQLKGYDVKALEMFPLTLMEGRLPQAPGELAIEYWMLDYLPGKPKLGDRIRLDTGIRKSKDSGTITDKSWSSSEVFCKESEKEFVIVGLIKPKFFISGGFLADGITFLEDTDLEKTELEDKGLADTGLPEDLKYSVYVKLDSVRNVPARAQEILAGFTPDGSGESGSGAGIEYNEKLLRLSARSINQNLNKSLTLLLAFIVILVIISTIAVIYNAFNISVLERVSQFGVLRCTGASGRQIGKIVLKEAWLFSAVGIPIGLACGILAMKVVMAVIGGMNFGSYDIFNDLRVVVSPAVLAISAAIGIITVYISAAGPARQASRISPMEAVRNAGSIKKENIRKVRKPVLGRLFFGIRGQLAMKNLRRNKKRFRVTVFSMIISIVLYIVFGSFVDYVFRIGAVNTDMGLDFTLSVSQNKIGGFAQDEYEKVKSLPGVDTVFKFMSRNVEVLVPEAKANPRFIELQPELVGNKSGGDFRLYNSMLISYGDSGFPDLQRNLKEGNADPDAMDRENSILLMAANKLYTTEADKPALIDAVKFKPGESIRFRAEPPGQDTEEAGAEKADTHTVKIAGILEKGILDNTYNYNGGICLITTEEVYKKFTGSGEFYLMGIRLKEGADKEAVARYLKSLSEEDPRYQYTDATVAAVEFRSTATAMSIFLYGFVGVITLIGCLNIINTISTNLILRTRELAMLKAVGMTQNGIKTLISLEGILHGIIAAFYGSILGAVLSYALFRLVNGINEFEWSMPWNHIAAAAAGATAVALVSGLIPLRKINRQNIMDSIRMEE